MVVRTAMVIAVICMSSSAQAQFSVPVARPDGATLFTRQCATCHVASATPEQRQGPNLWGVVGRKAGTYPGFKYTGAFAATGIVWNEATLDAYLTNPQAAVAGSMMVYRQGDPDIRHTIIAWLKDQH